jgi:hypothetical protein
VTLLRPIKDPREAGFFVLAFVIFTSMAIVGAVTNVWGAVLSFGVLALLSLGRLVQFVARRPRIPR